MKDVQRYSKKSLLGGNLSTARRLRGIRLASDDTLRTSVDDIIDHIFKSSEVVREGENGGVNGMGKATIAFAGLQQLSPALAQQQQQPEPGQLRPASFSAPDTSSCKTSRGNDASPYDSQASAVLEAPTLHPTIQPMRLTRTAVISSPPRQLGGASSLDVQQPPPLPPEPCGKGLMLELPGGGLYSPGAGGSSQADVTQPLVSGPASEVQATTTAELSIARLHMLMPAEHPQQQHQQLWDIKLGAAAAALLPPLLPATLQPFLTESTGHIFGDGSRREDEVCLGPLEPVVGDRKVARAQQSVSTVAPECASPRPPLLSSGLNPAFEVAQWLQGQQMLLEPLQTLQQQASGTTEPVVLTQIQPRAAAESPEQQQQQQRQKQEQEQQPELGPPQRQQWDTAAGSYEEEDGAELDEMEVEDPAMAHTGEAEAAGDGAAADMVESIGAVDVDVSASRGPEVTAVPTSAAAAVETVITEMLNATGPPRAAETEGVGGMHDAEGQGPREKITDEKMGAVEAGATHVTTAMESSMLPAPISLTRQQEPQQEQQQELHLASQPVPQCTTCGAAYLARRCGSSGFFARGTRAYTCRTCCMRNAQHLGFFGPPGTSSMEEAGGRECEYCGVTGAQKWHNHPSLLGRYMCYHCYRKRRSDSGSGLCTVKARGKADVTSASAPPSVLDQRTSEVPKSTITAPQLPPKSLTRDEGMHTWALEAYCPPPRAAALRATRRIAIQQHLPLSPRQAARQFDVREGGGSRRIVPPVAAHVATEVAGNGPHNVLTSLPEDGKIDRPMMAGGRKRRITDKFTETRVAETDVEGEPLAAVTVKLSIMKRPCTRQSCNEPGAPRAEEVLEPRPPPPPSPPPLKADATDSGSNGREAAALLQTLKPKPPPNPPLSSCRAPRAAALAAVARIVGQGNAQTTPTKRTDGAGDGDGDGDGRGGKGRGTSGLPGSLNKPRRKLDTDEGSTAPAGKPVDKRPRAAGARIKDKDNNQYPSGQQRQNQYGAPSAEGNANAPKCVTCSMVYRDRPGQPNGFFARGTRAYTCDSCCRRNLKSLNFYGPPGTTSLTEAGGRECEECGVTGDGRWKPHKIVLGAYVCGRCNSSYLQNGHYPTSAGRRNGKVAKADGPRVASTTAAAGDVAHNTLLGALAIKHTLIDGPCIGLHPTHESQAAEGTTPPEGFRPIGETQGQGAQGDHGVEQEGVAMAATTVPHEHEAAAQTTVAVLGKEPGGMQAMAAWGLEDLIQRAEVAVEGALEPLQAAEAVQPPAVAGIKQQKPKCIACGTTYDGTKSKGFFARGTRAYTCHACCARNRARFNFYGPPGTTSLTEAGGRECEDCKSTETTTWHPHKLALGVYACNRCDSYLSRHGCYPYRDGGLDGEGAKINDPRVTAAAACDVARANTGWAGGGGSGSLGKMKSAAPKCAQRATTIAEDGRKRQTTSSPEAMSIDRTTTTASGTTTANTTITGVSSETSETSAVSEAATSDDFLATTAGVRQPRGWLQAPPRARRAKALGQEDNVAVNTEALHQLGLAAGILNDDGGGGRHPCTSTGEDAGTGGTPDVKVVWRWIETLWRKVKALIRDLVLEAQMATWVPATAEETAAVTATADNSDEHLRSLRLTDMIYRWMEANVWHRALALMLGPAAAALALDREGPIAELSEEQQVAWDLCRSNLCGGFADAASAAMGEQTREPVTDEAVRRFQDVASQLAEGLAKQLVLDETAKWSVAAGAAAAPASAFADPDWPAVIASVILPDSRRDARALAAGPLRPQLLAVAAEGLRLALRLGMGAGGPGQLVARTRTGRADDSDSWVVAPGVNWRWRRRPGQQGAGASAVGSTADPITISIPFHVMEVQLVAVLTQRSVA